MGRKAKQRRERKALEHDRELAQKGGFRQLPPRAPRPKYLTMAIRHELTKRTKQ